MSANVGGFQYMNFPDEVAVQSAVFTRKGCERVIRFAFELAMERKKKKHQIKKKKQKNKKNL